MAKSKRTARKERKRAGIGKLLKSLNSGGKNTIRIPDGVTLFRPVDKSYRLDFILYEVGEGNKNADPGSWYFERTFYTHRIGVDNRYVVCPTYTFGKPCPVCEELAKIKKDPDATDEEEKSLRASKRQLFLVVDRDEPEKGVQIFEHSYHQFGRTLIECLNEADDDEEHISNFDDPEGGSCLRVKFRKNAPFGIEVSNIEFRPRPNGIDDSLLDHGICLDDAIVETPYKEIEKILFQTVEGDDEDGDEETEVEEKKPVTKGRGRPKGSTSKAPVEKPKKKKVVVEEDDEDDEDDEEEAVNPAKKAGLNVGMAVEYEGMEMEIVKISGDGTSLTLQDEDEDLYKAVGCDEVKIIKNDEDADEDGIPFEDDEDEPPKKKRGRPAKKPVAKKEVSKKKKPVVEEDDDEVEDDEDDDEEWDADLDDDED